MKHRVKRHTVVQPPDQSIKLIPLTRGQTAIVDVTDYDWLNQWNWLAQWNPGTKSFYAVRGVRCANGKVDILAMHKTITGFAMTDHRNHDTLDNRRSNLRECSRSQNGGNRRTSQDNSSGFKGVSWNRQLQKWHSYITVIDVNRTRMHLGFFLNAETAAKAYDAAARQSLRRIRAHEFQGNGSSVRVFRESFLLPLMAFVVVDAGFLNSFGLPVYRRVCIALGLTILAYGLAEWGRK